MAMRRMQEVLRENADLKRELDRLRAEARRNVSASDELVLARRKIDDLLMQLDSTYQRNFTLNKKVIRLESRVKELKAENNTLHNRIAKVVLMEVLKKESAA
jgi:cell division septum initiation protein DivIVA